MKGAALEIEFIDLSETVEDDQRPRLGATVVITNTS